MRDSDVVYSTSNLRHLSFSVPQHQPRVFNSFKRSNSSCVGSFLRSGDPFVTQHAIRRGCGPKLISTAEKNGPLLSSLMSRVGTTAPSLSTLDSPAGLHTTPHQAALHLKFRHQRCGPGWVTLWFSRALSILQLHSACLGLDSFPVVQIIL
jgi:hypothetical protein